MTRRELRDIVRWTFVSAVITCGIVGIQSAIGQSDAISTPLPTVQKDVSPFTFRLEQLQAKKDGQVRVQLTIVNGSRANETLKPTLQLVQRTFTASGGGGGRVASAVETKDTVLAFKNANAKVPAADQWASAADFDLPKVQGKVVPGTYAVRLAFNGSPLLVLYISVKPPMMNKTTPPDEDKRDDNGVRV